MKYFPRIIAVCLCMICSAIVRAENDAGPRDWTDPTEAPKLHNLLPEKDYADQLAALEAKAKPDQVKDDTPWAGVRVKLVDPHSQAKSLGIQRGDVLVYSNGQQLLDFGDWIQHRDANDSAVTVWSPSNGRKDYTLKPGLLGVNLTSYFRPEVRYLHELHPQDKPDPILFAAAACAQETPELARTALSHLQSSGATDRYIYFVDAIAALGQGDFDGALSSGTWAMHLGSDWQKKILAPMMRSAALASFRLTLAAQIEKDYPATKVTEADPDTGKDLTVDLSNLIQQCDATKWPGPQSCADAFAQLKPRDRSSEMTVTGQAGAGGNMAANSIRRGKPAQFDAPENQYNVFQLGPAAGNVRFTARCRFSLNRLTPANFTEPSVSFGFVIKGKRVLPISMLLNDEGDVNIGGSHFPDLSYRLANAYKTGRPFDVVMTVVGSRCEIDVGGVRVFYGPILEPAESRKLSVWFEAVGARGQLNHVTWETAPQ